MVWGIEETKRETAIANRVLAEVGLATGALAALGHASMRVPSDPDKFVVKGRGYPIDALSRMRPDDMVVCDLDGNKIDGPENIGQCFEVKIHSTIYKSHPEVNGVVHVHPRYTVMLSVQQARIVPMCPEGVMMVRNPLPLYNHMRMISTEEEGMEVANTMAASPGILLRGHGAVTAAASVDQAVMNMLGLEEQAKMNWYARCAFGPDYQSIPDELVDDMIDFLVNPTWLELPHLKGNLSTNVVNGVWNHYSELVSRDI
jgi:ribulose-5-phosphate 4-epimerase/fuculose-1-phosphate aldolase